MDNYIEQFLTDKPTNVSLYEMAPVLIKSGQRLDKPKFRQKLYHHLIEDPDKAYVIDFLEKRFLDPKVAIDERKRSFRALKKVVPGSDQYWVNLSSALGKDHEFFLEILGVIDFSFFPNFAQYLFTESDAPRTLKLRIFSFFEENVKTEMVNDLSFDQLEEFYLSYWSGYSGLEKYFQPRHWIYVAEKYFDYANGTVPADEDNIEAIKYLLHNASSDRKKENVICRYGHLKGVREDLKTIIFSKKDDENKSIFFRALDKLGYEDIFEFIKVYRTLILPGKISEKFAQEKRHNLTQRFIDNDLLRIEDARKIIFEGNDTKQKEMVIRQYLDVHSLDKRDLIVDIVLDQGDVGPNCLFHSLGHLLYTPDFCLTKRKISEKYSDLMQALRSILTYYHDEDEGFDHNIRDMALYLFERLFEKEISLKVKKKYKK